MKDDVNLKNERIKELEKNEKKLLQEKDKSDSLMRS
jgi:hypothetical protein